MIKINKHIEIVCSTEPGLSSMSQPSRDAIQTVLSKYYANVRVTIVNRISDLEALAARNPDLVFLGMKYLPVHPSIGMHDSEKIWISEYLDQNNILYTGSNQLAHELEWDKSLAKQRILDVGLKTSPFHVSVQNQLPNTDNMLIQFPLFVKPTSRGGGSGIDSASVAHNFDDLHAKIQSITDNLQSDSIIEEYLPGREFSVAILKDKRSPEYTVMPLELIAPADKDGVRLLSAAVKTADTERSMAVTDEVIKSKVSILALNAFHALGARDYGRIDIRLDKSGTPQFLEANLMPSLKRNVGNYFPKACLLNIDLDYEPMLLSIVRLAFARDEQHSVQPVPALALPLALEI